MTDIGFYHCTRAPAVEVAVRLIAKAHAAGARILVTGAPAGLAALDKALWTADAESFLPHAMAGAAEDGEQPILLSETAAAANDATLLVALQSGVPSGFDRYARILNLFEEGGEAHQRARADWKALGGVPGVTRTYWQQKDGGGWEKKA